MNRKIISMINYLPNFREEFLVFKSKATDVIQNFWYDTLNQEKPYYDFEKLPKEIQIIATYDKKNKSFYAECPYLNDVYTASATIEGLIEGINDLVYDYCGVPRYISKKLPLNYNPPEDQLKRLKVSKAKTPEATINATATRTFSRDYVGA